MMISRYIPVLLGLSLCIPAAAQTLVGMPKTEVEKTIRNEHREFREDHTVVRQQFNYLKYVNRLGTRTWILYFNENDICRTSKLVCDYAEYDEVMDALSRRADKAGDSLWEYSVGSDTFRIQVIKKEWYFSLRETRK